MQFYICIIELILFTNVSQENKVSKIIATSTQRVLMNKVHGILLTTFVAIIGTFLSSFIGKTLLGFGKSPLSPVLLAIVVGIIISNTFSISDKYKDGINFIIGYILKLGIILLGIGISFFELVNIGLVALPVIAITITTGLCMTIVVAKILGLENKLAALLCVGSSICGATAIATLSPVIDAKKEQTAYAIVVVALFGTVAMSSYPYLVDYLFTSPLQKGMFLGTSIHDTSQVLGAGLIYVNQFGSSLVLDATVITKLMRNSFMIIAIPLVAFLSYKLDAKHSNSDFGFNYKKAFPLFIVGFLALAVIRSLGDAAIANDAFIAPESWTQIISSVTYLSKSICLVLAMAAIGLNTNFKTVFKIGYKPLFAGFVIALSIGVVNYLSISLLVE